MTKRDKGLIEYYALGYSMRETAARFGLSIERVRQVLRKHAPKLIRSPHNTSNHSTGLSSSTRRAMAQSGGQ